MQGLIRFVASSVIFAATSVAYAAERDVYDSDHDGLIEIEDLQDLNEIRNNPVIKEDGSKGNDIFGHTLYQSKAGCPDSGCKGYELVSDLNFDTNNNGRFDEGDQYWNDGKGWQPIGGFALKFAAEFNGNGHALHNLVIKRPGEYFVSLFAYNERANFYDLKLTADIVSGMESGSLLGYSWQTKLTNIQADVKITAEAGDESCKFKCDADSVGGLVGPADELTAKNITLNAEVSGRNRIAGLSGSATGSSFTEVAVKAKVNAGLKVGGVIAHSYENSYDKVFVNAIVTGKTTLGVLAASNGKDSVNNALLTGKINLAAQTRFLKLGSLAGWSDKTAISKTLSLVSLPENKDGLYFIGGLYGESSSMKEITSAYWAKDLTHTDRSNGRNTVSGRIFSQADLADLQCATAAANACNNVRLQDFDQQKNSQDQTLWEFGSNTEAPGMKINNFSFVDKQGDGIVDDWPQLTRPVVTPDTPDTPDKPDNPTPPGNTEPESSSSSGGSLSTSVWLWLMIFGLIGRNPSCRLRQD